MINVNELRIGNKLEWNKQEFNVCRIFNQNEGVENENWTKPCSELHPIPLTEEWLVKMGFEYSVSTVSYSIFFDDYNGVLRIKPIGTELNVWMKRNNRTIRLVEVKYVHQLQNLYFTLTGEELTIGS